MIEWDWNVKQDLSGLSFGYPKASFTEEEF